MNVNTNFGNEIIWNEGRNCSHFTWVNLFTLHYMQTDMLKDVNIPAVVLSIPCFLIFG